MVVGYGGQLRAAKFGSVWRSYAWETVAGNFLTAGEEVGVETESLGNDTSLTSSSHSMSCRIKETCFKFVQHYLSYLSTLLFGNVLVWWFS